MDPLRATPPAPWCLYTVKLVRQRKKPPALSQQAVTPEAAAAYLHTIVARYEREVCGALLLDTANRATGYTVPFQGCLARAAVEPRALLQRALLANAAAMILFHNHPSGSLSPSPQDIHFTRRMILAGGLVGVVVTDHLILGAPPHFTSVVSHAGLQPDLTTLLSTTDPRSTPLFSRTFDRRQRVQPKYRHPVTQKTWSGRGNMAKWLAQEIEAGRRLEEFRVSPRE